MREDRFFKLGTVDPSRFIAAIDTLGNKIDVTGSSGRPSLPASSAAGGRGTVALWTLDSVPAAEAATAAGFRQLVLLEAGTPQLSGAKA